MHALRELGHIFIICLKDHLLKKNITEIIACLQYKAGVELMCMIALLKLYLSSFYVLICKEEKNKRRTSCPT